MLHVACVRAGTAFGVEYVERLFDMVRRNLPAGFAGRFVCFTDRPADLAHLEGVELRLLEPGLDGWWGKLQLFAADSFPVGDRVWFFDLDTVITGPLDTLFDYPGAFALLEDVYRGFDCFQSSVMTWIAGSPLPVGIFAEWQAHDMPRPAGGDQAVLEMYWREWLPAKIGGTPWQPDRLQWAFPGVLRSYKIDCVWQIPKGTSVVFFHGLPRPHEVRTGWVPEVWKVGGGTVAQLELVPNVPQKQILDNVADAMGRGYAQLAATPPHGQVAILCGGGPSLKDNLLLIANMQRGGAIVFACNQVDGYLRQHGITPNFHVMIDARGELCNWVNQGGIKLYASMCDYYTLVNGDTAGDLVMFHKLTEGVDRVLGNAMIVGGGTTAGTTCLALAWIMGFRRMLCFGYDSCYAGAEHHAYRQPLNDGEPVLDAIVGGKKFRAAPWMVQQAEDFKEIAIELTRMGCEVVVHGGGLIGAMVAALRESTVDIDGFRWPSRDVETRASVFGTLEDARQFVRLCDQRRIAIQAGGNVGIWPLELAKSFETVHTFEPDPLNWECLRANVKVPNVIAHQAALGDAPGRAGLERHPSNCGAHAIIDGDEFPVVTIDSLELGKVDLIQLDVEGYELQALKGAKRTIERCSPTIVLELKGLGARYGYTDQEVDQVMHGFGYERIGVAHRDVIYKRVSNGRT